MAEREKNLLFLIEAPGALENYSLVRLDGREMLSTPFEFRLTVRANGDIPDASVWVGAPITFRLGSEADVHRTLNGQCVRFEHAYQKGPYVEFVLDVTASVNALRLNRDNRIFTQTSIKSVVAQILTENDITFDDSKVSGATETLEYIVQYAESDFDFVSRLLERSGIFYYFRYDDGAGRFKHKMILADDETGFFDGKPFSLSFRRDHLLMGLAESETSYTSTAAAWLVNDYDYKSPKALTPTKTSTRLNYASKSSTVYEWPGGGPTPEGVRSRSKIAMEESESATLLVEGTGSYVTFAPGARYEIDETRLVTRERRIAIRSVSHAAWDPWGLEEGEPSYHQQFTAVPSDSPYRPPSITPPAVVRGPQTAVVIDQVDAEGFGRVKVRFHWDRHGSSTCWLRVAQQWAGQHIGAQFVPRVNMEVLVDFLEGDPDRPLVVACLYNGDNKHPFDVPAKLSQAGWRTKSHPDGDVVQVFQFEDKAGGEEIYTYAGRNLRRDTMNDENVDIRGLSTLHVGKDETVTIDGQSTLTVGKDSKEDIKGKLTISVGGDEAISTAGDFKVHAQGAIELDADGSGTMHSTGQITIRSSQGISLQVGGSTVSITPSGISISGPLVTIN